MLLSSLVLLGDDRRGLILAKKTLLTIRNRRDSFVQEHLLGGAGVPMNTSVTQGESQDLPSRGLGGLALGRACVVVICPSPRSATTPTELQVQLWFENTLA